MSQEEGDYKKTRFFEKTMQLHYNYPKKRTL